MTMISEWTRAEETDYTDPSDGSPHKSYAYSLPRPAAEVTREEEPEAVAEYRLQAE